MEKVPVPHFQSAPRSRFSLIVLLAVVLAVGFCLMPGEEMVGDPQSINGEVLHFLYTGSLAMPPALVPKASSPNVGKYYSQNPTTREWFSKYGVFNEAMSTPPMLALRLLHPRASVLPNGDIEIVNGGDDRVLVLNLYNLLLGALSAAYLFVLARRYSDSVWTPVVFVLVSFYCTFWWYYLRAQNSEIYQVLFMVAFVYHLVEALDSRDSKMEGSYSHAWLAGIFCGVLILTKTFFLLLIPIVSGAIMLRCFVGWRNGTGGISRAGRIGGKILIPIFGAVVLLLLANQRRFGSPFSTGYETWQADHHPIFSGSFWKGTAELLFSAQGSIFLHFPVLIFALIGYGAFARRWPFDACVLSVLGLVVFVVISKLYDPLGYWCYGPRYLLPILPLLSLPFIIVLDYLKTNWSSWRTKAAAIVLVSVLAFSLRSQMMVNSFPFFANFQVALFFEGVRDPVIDDYFNNNNFAVIYTDMANYKRGTPWLPRERLMFRWTQDHINSFNQYFQEATKPNYYFLR